MNVYVVKEGNNVHTIARLEYNFYMERNKTEILQLKTIPSIIFKLNRRDWLCVY